VLEQPACPVKLLSRFLDTATAATIIQTILCVGSVLAMLLVVLNGLFVASTYVSVFFTRHGMSPCIASQFLVCIFVSEHVSHHKSRFFLFVLQYCYFILICGFGLIEEYDKYNL